LQIFHLKRLFNYKFKQYGIAFVWRYHWIYDILEPREDTVFIRSTYEDNPFLSSEIIKEIQSKEKASHNAFNQVIKQLKSSGALSENGESFKNGRRVLSINAGQKRKINVLENGWKGWRI